MSWYAKLFLCFFLLAGVACSSTSSTLSTGDDDDDDDTTTDTLTLDTSTLAGTLEDGAQSLVMSISASDVEASLSTGFQAAMTGTTEQWDQYFTESTSYLLTDIFGPADEAPAVVTKISVQLESVFGSIESILSFDTALNCALDADGVATVDEIAVFTSGDTDALALPFFGDVENGVTADRRFDCIIASEEDTSTMIYGVTDDDTFSFAIMDDNTSVNDNQADVYGDQVRIAQVTLVTYAQSTTDEITTGFLDLQYAQATIYNGLDDEFQFDNADSTDDQLFKSRSRITGTFTVDADGNPGAGTGEFFVTKYDQGSTPEGDPVVVVTQAHGRGGYAAEEHSIFDIATTSDVVSDANGSFCLQMPASGSVPTTASESNCADLETDFAWGATTFPFDLSPALDQTFADASLFAGDDTDLIANDVSNFTMPDYAVSE